MVLRLRNVLVVALPVALGLFGCGADGDGRNAPEGTFVGAVEGTDAYVAVVSDGVSVAGYVCDGIAGQGISVNAWFKAELSDREAELLTRTGDPLGSVVLSDEDATGEVEIGGETYAFAAEPASGEAGVYRGIEGEIGKEGTVEAGWIVLPDGTQRGGIGTWVANPEGTSVGRASATIPVYNDAAAPRLNTALAGPITLNLSGATIQVDKVTDPDGF